MKYIIDDIKVMSEWDTDKNDSLGLDPSKISINSKKKVFWKCSNGHSWDVEPFRKTRGAKCKYCSLSERSLAVKFPGIAKEWDVSLNGDLTPEAITYGSKKKVSWICPICTESYKATITNRTGNNKRGCPYCCHNPRVNSTNNLLAKNAELAKEWDDDKNDFSPDKLTPNSNEKVWWICKEGHSFDATVNNRSSGHGCPFCSGQKVCDDNSLAFINPQLAKEWHPTKNKKSANEVTSGANQYTWWICEKGHEWSAKVSNRNGLKQGCPECAKGSYTSVPERIIYFYVKLLFPNAINSHKYNKSEIDIFIPSLNVGIEYDGEHYHKKPSNYKRDLAKNKLLFENNIQLIRIREEKCHPMEDERCKIINCKFTSDYKYLNELIQETIKYLCLKADIENNIMVDIDEVKSDIISEYNNIPYNKSFAFLHKDLVKEWNDINLPLKPEMFLPMSEQKVSWICSVCGGVWNAPIKSKSLGYGCSRCAKRHQYSTSGWIQKATEIHKGKYDYSKVDYVNSQTIVDIICPIHHDFPQNPSEHLGGKGCPYCANQKAHPLNRLSERYPEIAKEWDYDMNSLKPSEVGGNHKEKFWWKCNKGKYHSYLAFIQQRIRGSGCAVCHGKQVVYKTSLAYLYPEIAKQWIYEKNKGLSPENITAGSDKIIWWRCEQGHEWPTQVYNRTKRVGCMKCYRHQKIRVL